MEPVQGSLVEGMVVLGLDPAAFRNAGWGAVKFEGGKAVLLEKFTQVIERPENDVGGRLRDMYNKTKEMIEKHKPTLLCVERSTGGGLMFVRNNLSEAVGVVKLCCHDHGVRVYETSPAHLKLVIAGNGRAKKKHIKANIAAWFGLKKTGVEHECDAVAFALGCLIDMGWKGYQIAVPFVPQPKKKKAAKAKVETTEAPKLITGELGA